jgi:hypothetical protein
MTNIKESVQAKVNKEEGTILISTKFYTFTFLGASCSCSASPRDRCESLTIAPQKGKKGLIALVIHKGDDQIHHVVLLSFSYNENGPLINLEREYAQADDRLCQINLEKTQGRGFELRYAELYVTIKGRIYSQVSYTRELAYPKIDADGNLICRYVIGDITKKEFLKQAKKRRIWEKIVKQYNTFLDWLADWLFKITSCH